MNLESLLISLSTMANGFSLGVCFPILTSSMAFLNLPWLLIMVFPFYDNFLSKLCLWLLVKFICPYVRNPNAYCPFVAFSHSGKSFNAVFLELFVTLKSPSPYSLPIGIFLYLTTGHIMGGFFHHVFDSGA